MHNIWVRLNAVIFFGLTVLLFLATLCAFSTFLHTDQPIVKTLKVNNLKSLRNHGGSDRALLSFDLNADLRPAFHWNLKQLFVFVVAEYESDLNVLNQIIIWDKIISSKNDAFLKIKDEFVKYALIDQGSDLRNKTVKLRLIWDHMPVTGRMYFADNSNFTYTLPGKYKY
mmetsp:Transcript_24219/g.22024  ORF Transcript_24219/g.22024 Transcript_24219/m.22024 type:complete len:170 (+) Transcript_24219:35-544(+)